MQPLVKFFTDVFLFLAAILLWGISVTAVLNMKIAVEGIVILFVCITGFFLYGYIKFIAPLANDFIGLIYNGEDENEDE